MNLDSTTKFLVVGGSGSIGSYFVKWLSKRYDVVYTYLNHKPYYGKGIVLDITNKKDTIEIINTERPNIVIHTAALANVDKCETDHFLADKINVDGTRNIIEGCSEIDCKLVYVSTTFVFDGLKNEFTEGDYTNPTTYYGRTKELAEQSILKSKLKSLILRTDQPYYWKEDWQRTNTVLRTIEILRSNNILKEIVDWHNVPTYVPDFVDATVKLIEANETGIFHLTGSEYINRYDWALIIAEIFGLNKNLIVPINSEELNLPAKRRNVNVSNKKITEKTGIQMKGIKEGLSSMLKEQPFS